jgi:hypothetical protein
MFSYHENGLKKTKESIDITVKMLQSLIKANSCSASIEQLRQIEYGSEEYKKFKSEQPFPCCKPHGLFINKWDTILKKNTEELQKLSGYLYFDVDNSEIPAEYKNNVDDYKKMVIANYPNNISMLGKSIGGRGIFFLVKVKGLTEDNFLSVHQYFRTIAFKDLPIDTKALGIARNFFIPMDEDLYVNEEVISKAEILSIENINQRKKGTARCIKGKNSLLRDDIHLSAPLTSYMPIEDLLSIINMKTPVATNGYAVVVKPVDFIKCFIPKHIRDDYKHSIFSSITNVLVHLNPHLPVFYFKSFMWWVNQNYTCGKPMLRREMESVVQYSYDNSKANKLWETNKKWLRTKWVHFDKNCGYTPKQKQKMSARLTGDRKISETTDIIEAAIFDLEQTGIEPIQVNIIKRLQGIRSATTVKKYWKVIMAKVAVAGSETSIEHIQLPVPLETDVAPEINTQTPSLSSCTESCQNQYSNFTKPGKLHQKYLKCQLDSS